MARAKKSKSPPVTLIQETYVDRVKISSIGPSVSKIVLTSDNPLSPNSDTLPRDGIAITMPTDALLRLCVGLVEHFYQNRKFIADAVQKRGRDFQVKLDELQPAVIKAKSTLIANRKS